MKEYIAPGIIGAGLFTIGWFQRRKVAASRTWTSTQGTVTKISVCSELQRGGEDEADHYTYFPDVHYSYSAGAQSYSSNSIRFDRRGYGSDSAARKALDAYQPGQTVEVFYNPAKPAQAVLERKNPAGTALLLIGGGILALAVFAALFGR